MKNRQQWRIYGYLMLWLFTMMPQSSYAEKLDNLYEVQRPVTDRSIAQRDSQLEEAFKQLILKVSGSAQVLQSQSVQRALTQPMHYVEQYVYQQQTLQARFSDKLIGQLINQAGYPVWGPIRPVLILWLGIESAETRRLATLEQDLNLYEIIQGLAQTKGLPLIIPLLDLQDVASVTISDIWNQFPSGLKKASLRYAPDGILVGKLKEINDDGLSLWEGQWQLLVEGQAHSWQTPQQSLAEAALGGVDGATKYLAHKYGTNDVVQVGQPLRIKIEDIYSAEDYAKVVDYLNNLGILDDIEVKSIAANYAVFEVSPKGSEGYQALKQGIEYEHHLTALAKGHALSEAVDLVYRWVP